VVAQLGTTAGAGRNTLSKADILVVLPTLGDRLDTLAETLDAIDVQRVDAYFTLVVVAPAKAVAARALAKKHGAVIVDDPGTGISEAINCGLRARNGEEFYAWMGDDDLFRPNGLNKLQSILQSRPDAVLAFGGCDYIDPHGRTLAVSNAGKLAPFLLPWGPDLIPHPGTMVRLDALEEIGGFDVNLRYAMDLDAFLKLRRFGKFAYTRESVSAFRWHPDSLTVSNRTKSSLESEAVKRRHLPAVLRPVSYLWSYPIRWASAYAAKSVNARAHKLPAVG
jgi:glycosyltransferase involved in cell wall biosynthesis